MINHRPRIFAVTLLCIACAAVGGCTQVAGLAATASSPASIPAIYTPRKVVTLILAEHPPGALADDASAEDIGRRVADQWRSHDLSPMVAPDAVESLRANHRADFHSMSIGAIGRAVGAAQVLYIDVLENRVESASGSEMVRGKAAVRLRMIDTGTGQTLWPTDAANGYPVDAESEYIPPGDGVSESTVLEQTRAAIAEDAVRLFYVVQPDK